MKEFKIEVPNGFEIDLNNSDLSSGVIKFKEVEFKWPDSVDEIGGREWYLDGVGGVRSQDGVHSSIQSTANHMSSKQRAEAVLALIQLLELRDYVNQGWVPDWGYGTIKYTIKACYGRVIFDVAYNFSSPLYFKNRQTAEKFLEKYKDLIEKAKELI